MPSMGKPEFYFKSINKFSKSEFTEENKIQNNLKFEISSEDNANLDTPILYNNLANPITLTYINNNIKTDYTITDTSTPITYDGSLLKRCQVPLESIKTNISFDIYITNNLNQKFKSSVYLEIPLKDENTSILDGSITQKKAINTTFYRYE